MVSKEALVTAKGREGILKEDEIVHLVAMVVMGLYTLKYIDYTPKRVNFTVCKPYL